jgi:dipeptidyl aminopeptidase/acylaminoacyl peptidase
VGERVCLRCDWTGETDQETCPRCGAPLYRVQEPTTPGEAAEAPRPQPQPAGDPTPSSPIDVDQDEESVPPGEPVVASRRWWLIGGGFAVAAVLIVATSLPFDHAGTSPAPATQPTESPGNTIPESGYLFDLKTGERTPLPESITRGPHGELYTGEYAVSPDGTMVAYASPGDPEPSVQIFIANLDGTNVHQVTHNGSSESASPDWSPDGSAIVYNASDHEGVLNIFALDLATGETSQITNEKPTHPCFPCDHPHPVGAAAPQFTPDGASIVHDVYRGDHVGVWITPVTGGKSVLLVGSGKNGVEANAGTLSPDGSTLAVACFGRLEGICIADADGTNLRKLVSDSVTPPKWSPDGTRIAYTAQAPTLKVFVVEVATGATTFVAAGRVSDWLDDHTLIFDVNP